MTDQTLPRPTVEITACRRVSFYSPLSGDGRMVGDDGTTERFSDWMLTEKIYSLRGTGGGGPGRKIGDYIPSDADRIRAWAEAEGLDITEYDEDEGLVDTAALIVYGALRLCLRVEELMHRQVIDARSPAGDALLDLHQQLEDFRKLPTPRRPFDRFDRDVAEGTLP